MKLLLDCGNTRLKWALADTIVSAGVQAGHMVRRGVCSYGVEDLAALTGELASVCIEQMCYASVVAPALEASVLAPFKSRGLAPVRFCVTQQEGALCNGYATQETLGVDRWAAAIGAWHRIGASCLVVSAGTATTIDLIDAGAGGAIYRGGLILPGIDLMLQSLHQRAARLPLAEGVYRAAPDVPDNTHDALMTGAMDATCGAIERMAKRLPDDAAWLITGGNAGRLQEVLGARVQVVEDLALEGLAIHALNHQ